MDGNTPKIRLCMSTPAECLLIHYMLSSATNKNNRLKLNIVETGVLDFRHALRVWLFTSKTGTVLKKQESKTNLPYFRSSFAKIQRRRVESDSPFCIAWLAPAVKNAGENLPLISAQKQSSAGSGVVVMNITEFKATIDEMLLRKSAGPYCFQFHQPPLNGVFTGKYVSGRLGDTLGTANMTFSVGTIDNMNAARTSRSQTKLARYMVLRLRECMTRLVDFIQVAFPWLRVAGLQADFVELPRNEHEDSAGMTELWLHHVHHVMFSVTRPVPTADFKHSSNRLFANAVADRISGTQVPSLTRKSVISPRIRHAVAMSRLLSPKRRNMKPSADDFRSSVGGAGANNTTRENELNTTAAGLPNDEQRVEYMPAVQSNERRKMRPISAPVGLPKLPGGGAGTGTMAMADIGTVDLSTMAQFRAKLLRHQKDLAALKRYMDAKLLGDNGFKTRLEGLETQSSAMKEQLDSMQETVHQNSANLESTKSLLQFKIHELEVRLAMTEKRTETTASLQQSLRTTLTQDVSKFKVDAQAVRGEQTAMTKMLTNKMDNLNHSVGESLARSRALEPRMAAMESDIKSAMKRHASFVSVYKKDNKEKLEQISQVMDVARDAQTKIDTLGQRKYGGGWNVGLGRGGFKRNKDKIPNGVDNSLTSTRSVINDTNNNAINSNMRKAALAAVARAGGASQRASSHCKTP